MVASFKVGKRRLKYYAISRWQGTHTLEHDEASHRPRKRLENTQTPHIHHFTVQILYHLGKLYSHWDWMVIDFMPDLCGAPLRVQQRPIFVSQVQPEVKMTHLYSIEVSHSRQVSHPSKPIFSNNLRLAPLPSKTIAMTCLISSAGQAPNGQRYPLGMGRGDAILPEPGPSHTNC